MLRDNLYSLETIEKTDNEKFQVGIAIDPSHDIFKGHFPGHPVLPGVCLIEMVKETVQEITGIPHRLHTAETIKYLKMVDPRTDIYLQFSIEISAQEQALKVSATSFLKDGSANFKFKGKFFVT